MKRACLGDNNRYRLAYSSAFGTDGLVARRWMGELNGCGCELSQGILWTV